LKCSYDDSLYGFHTYQGPTPKSWFAQHLTVIAAWVEDHYENPVNMAPLTEKEEEELRDPNTCSHICGKKLPPKLRLRARDHFHLTGRYRGPAPISRQPDYSRSFL